MKRYLRLLRIFWGNTLAAEMEYRTAFWANAALSLFWLAWAAVGIGAFFRFAPSVRGWTYDELLVVMGIFFAINGFRQAVISPNLAMMTEYVRMGTLDFLLTKPVSSQFMVSLRHVGVYNWLDPLLGFGLVIFGLIRRGDPVSLMSVLTFGLLTVAAGLVTYSLALAIQCLAVWTIGGEGLDDLVQGIVEAGRFPVQMYRGVVRTVLTFLIPVALLTTVPAEAILGRGSTGILVISCSIAALLLLVTSRLWIWSLRHYTGASA